MEALTSHTVVYIKYPWKKKSYCKLRKMSEVELLAHLQCLPERDRHDWRLPDRLQRQQTDQ